MRKAKTNKYVSIREESKRKNGRGGIKTGSTKNRVTRSKDKKL